MDDISTYEEETAQSKVIRIGSLILVFLFVIVVACISVVDGFSGENKEGVALMGIGLALFCITTFVLVRRIYKQDIDEAAKIPTYLQLIILVFFGIAILIVDNTKTSSSSGSNTPSCTTCTYCAFTINGTYHCGSYSLVNGTRTCTLSLSNENEKLNSVPMSKISNDFLLANDDSYTTDSDGYTSDVSDTSDTYGNSDTNNVDNENVNNINKRNNVKRLLLDESKNKKDFNPNYKMLKNKKTNRNELNQP